ncbi:phage tail tube protein [Aeromonas hydrophila]|uniref:phage tail tube protein n=1 Tax=Aeromonas TaxID=642 RepID=UPI001F4A0D7F|nr:MULTISPECIES: phage tail tube protein [unclassified Aeromonas]EIM1708951.1 phage tail tube protein [Aeromonas dhakensis]EIS3744260.1 phage tail tube protein [Aeromonas hydrophila]MCH7348596.1 phage tail tube protein [Aeromonas sp. MR7]HEH9405099.1 phage tail tube protein [Aeromonas bestiarum]
MGRIAGTCYFKVDGEQLSVTGGMEIPLNTNVKESIVGLDGGVDYKETHRSPYIKASFKIPKGFPLKKITTSDDMTITAELANGQVYVLKSAWLEGEANHNPEDGTADMQFNGKEGFHQ